MRVQGAALIKTAHYRGAVNYWTRGGPFEIPLTRNSGGYAN